MDVRKKAKELGVITTGPKETIAARIRKLTADRAAEKEKISRSLTPRPEPQTPPEVREPWKYSPLEYAAARDPHNAAFQQGSDGGIYEEHKNAVRQAVIRHPDKVSDDALSPYVDEEAWARSEWERRLTGSDSPTGQYVMPGDERQRGAVIAPSSKERGKWQVTYFDSDGFSRDQTFGSKRDAIADIRRDGFRPTESDVLGPLGKTDKFRVGNEKTRVVQMLNDQELPHEAHAAVMDAYRDKGLDAAREVYRKAKEPKPAPFTAPEGPKLATGTKAAGGGTDLFGNAAFEAKPGGQELFGFKQDDQAARREQAKTYAPEIERKELAPQTGRTETDAKIAQQYDETATPEMFEKPAAKEPWQMSREEFVASQRDAANEMFDIANASEHEKAERFGGPIREAIRNAPSFPKLRQAAIAAIKSIHNDPEYVARHTAEYDAEPESLLTAHASVMNAKSARAKTLLELAKKVIAESGVPTNKGYTKFRGDTERIDWDRAASANKQPHEPPVAPGHVRMYHGGKPPGPGESRWLTPDQKYAEGYASKSGVPVSYVDIPKSSPHLTKSFDDTDTGMEAPYNSFNAPPEIAAGLKPVAPAKEQPKGPPNAETVRGNPQPTGDEDANGRGAEQRGGDLQRDQAEPSR
jgi:hypothetical protein